MNEPVAYLNGQWIPATAAAVSVGDAGFVQGTAIAEQLRTFAGKLFRLHDHLVRLARSLEIVGVDAGMSLDELSRTAEELTARNHALLAPGDDLGLSIVVTPGIYSTFATEPRKHAGEQFKGDSPIFAETKIGTVPARPTLCLHTYPLPFHLFAGKYRDGQALATTDIEQVSARCWPPELKCRSRMHYYLADRQAAATDPQARALLLDAQGFVTEASTANVLIYSAGEGVVSPRFGNILHGISLAVAVELAGQLDIPFGEHDLTSDDVAQADEVFLTSTSTCMLPVTRFNGQAIGSGRPGTVFSRMLTAWGEMVGVDIAAQVEQHSRRER
jgi:branched-chain amino acid aminotransferase